MDCWMKGAEHSCTCMGTSVLMMVQHNESPSLPAHQPSQQPSDNKHPQPDGSHQLHTSYIVTSLNCTVFGTNSSLSLAKCYVDLDSLLGDHKHIILRI